MVSWTAAIDITGIFSSLLCVPFHLNCKSLAYLVAVVVVAITGCGADYCSSWQHMTLTAAQAGTHRRIIPTGAGIALDCYVPPYYCLAHETDCAKDREFPGIFRIKIRTG